MEQIDLRQLIEQYPEVLTDGTKLKAYILDLYPQCKRGMVNILVAIQQCGIVSEMQASKNPSALDMSRWKKVLDDDYGFAGATAEICLQMWCSAVGVQLEIKANAETKSNKPNDNIPPKIEEKADEALALRDSQNSQKDWFLYEGFLFAGAILKRVKNEYLKYKGEINIPKGVTCIGENAFAGCENLTTIIMPNGVTSIGNGAFKGCKSLISIAIDGCVTNIGDGAFKGCTELANVTIPCGVTSIKEKTFLDCASLVTVAIPNSVTTIGQAAFYGCTGLTSISIPDSVTNIGNYAFKRCTSLTSITIPSSVVSIGVEAFESSLIKTANIPILEKERKERELAEAKRREEQKRLEQQRLALEKERREKGVCQHCGGDFKGLFIKKCVYCGRKKDY